MNPRSHDRLSTVFATTEVINVDLALTRPVDHTPLPSFDSLRRDGFEFYTAAPARAAHKRLQVRHDRVIEKLVKTMIAVLAKPRAAKSLDAWRQADSVNLARLAELGAKSTLHPENAPS